MTPEQLSELRKAAEEATPGPWLVNGKQSVRGSFGEYIAKTNWLNGANNARHIAAANPATILQLLDYVELLEQVEENLCELHNEALKQVETLEKDAARYRWLRDTCMDDPKTRLAVMNGFIDYETVDYIYGEGMDVAIDAAMGESK